MEKSPQAFRTISEVAEEIGVPAHVLRFWESRFTQVRPIKRGGGRRYYRPEDVDLLRVIREMLYTEGLTIRGVQKLLKESGPKQFVERYGNGHLTIDDFGATTEDAASEAPQGDGSALFDDTAGVELADAPAAAAPAPAAAPTPPKPDPRQIALRSILTRLETLRTEMSRPIADPE